MLNKNMEYLKSFGEFINETFLEKPVDPELIGYDEKKMKKNGYIEATLECDVDDIKKGDSVFVSSTEYGQLESESPITCLKGEKKVIVQKKNIKIKM